MVGLPFGFHLKKPDPLGDFGSFCDLVGLGQQGPLVNKLQNSEVAVSE